MKTIIKITWIVLIFFFTGACNNFLDVNESLDNPEETTPNYLLPAIQGNMASTHYEQGETTSYFTQYVTTISGGYREKDRWDYRNTLRVGLWRKNYFDVAGNAEKMINAAREKDSHNYVGVGLIMKAFSFLTATDLFGDMPIDDAFSGIYNPTYDAQSEVYDFIDSWIVEGIAELEASDDTDPLMDRSADLIYGGDLQKWISFAHGLRARELLHTANFKNQYDEVLKEIDLAYKNWEDPFYFYSSDPNNDWERNLWGPSKARPQWDFITNSLSSSVSTDFFMSCMSLTDDVDPRLFKLTTPGENNNYYSIPSSEGLSGLSQNDFADLYDGYWTKDDSPIIYITEEELNFIESEASFYAGKKQRAYTSFINGVRNNFHRLGVTLDTIEMYMTSSAIPQSSNELTVSDIMTQKYIALYLQPETWVDMRRYKYDSTVYKGLSYPKNALSIYNGEYIQRLPYDPQTEYIYNPNEIARLNAQDPMWVVTKVWWADQSKL